MTAYGLSDSEGAPQAQCIRSAPQSRFSLDIRSMSSMVSLANGDLRTVPDLDFRLQRSRKPSRCQRTTVSGFTRRTASHQRRTMLDRNTSKPLSCGRKRGCSTLCDATISCCRSIMFSATSSCRERNASPTRPVMMGSGRSDSLSFFFVQVTTLPTADRTRALQTKRNTTAIWPNSATVARSCFSRILQSFCGGALLWPPQSPSNDNAMRDRIECRSRLGGAPEFLPSAGSMIDCDGLPDTAGAAATQSSNNSSGSSSLDTD
jgi:hypothetical protein